jgi:hypothetical protein
LCQCYLELERVRGSSFFRIGYFSLSKKFDHTTKNVSIFHFKLGGCCRLNYFSTSTPSRYTSQHRNQPITSDQFLTWKNTTNLLQGVDFWHGEILTYSFS